MHKRELERFIAHLQLHVEKLKRTIVGVPANLPALLLSLQFYEIIVHRFKY
jgi:hypothetical protein